LTHHRYGVLLLILCCSLLWATTARAIIPTTVKTASPLDPAAKKTIADDVTANTTTLVAGGDGQHDARKSLIDNADSTGGSATSDYQQEYAKTIMTAMQPGLADKKFSVQLNAAIVLGNVAKQVSRTNVADTFIPIAKDMLKNPSWPIVYWGMKIARYALADGVVNNNPQAKGLADDIVDAVKKHEKSGEIVEEAYQALTLEPIPHGGANFQASISVTIPTLLKLIDWRTSLYNNGAAPAAPGAEVTAATLLPTAAFDAIKNNPGLKSQVLTSLGNLTAAQLTVISSTAPTPDGDLVSATQLLGSAMEAFGANLGDDRLQAAGKDIRTKISNTTPGPTIDGYKEALATALHNMVVPAAQ
jgi:hypothetical protein